MKTTKLLCKFSMAMLFMALFFAPSQMQAQDKMEVAVIKDGYVMMDGKMMAVTSGKLTPMKKNVVMNNGTKVKKNGAVKPKNGKRMKMKNGNCIDHSGSIENCNVNSSYYTCSHHSDVRSAKKGKCPECGMALVKKN